MGMEPGLLRDAVQHRAVHQLGGDDPGDQSVAPRLRLRQPRPVPDLVFAQQAQAGDSDRVGGGTLRADAVGARALGGIVLDRAQGAAFFAPLGAALLLSVGALGCGSRPALRSGTSVTPSAPV